MLVLNGKYNYANIMVDQLDDTTIEQLQIMLNHPAFANTYIAVMPDAHKGNGAVIGFTSTRNNYVIPNIVGVDINCAVISVNIGKIVPNFVELDNFIRENIPCGFNTRKKKHFYVTAYDVTMPICEKVCKKIGYSYETAKLSVGTLGGGNHFIELDKAPNNDIWLTIHTGSRGFGNKIAIYHQNKAKELMKATFNGYKDLEFLPMGFGGQEYLDDMKVAQEFARINREAILQEIVGNFLNKEELETIESVHNYIDFKDNIIRKGAISAYKDKKVVIPLNMFDGVIIGTGKSNKKWNFSAPHGAGRVMSRTQAKKEISLESYKEKMNGIFSTCINEETLDEAPNAYKPMELILDSIKETVDVDFVMKPIFVFKDDTKRKRKDNKN